MKKITTKSLFAAGALAALLLSSCSKQITSISHSDKMASSEILTHKTVQPATVVLAGTDIKPTQGDVVINTVNPEVTAPKKEAKTTKVAQSKVSKVIASAGKFVVKIVTDEVKSQVAAISGKSANNHTASVSGADKPQGLGGIAAICATAAICMAIFGLIKLGTIFWYLSIILIVAAIVFFLVYLAGKAAGPSPGGE